MPKEVIALAAAGIHLASPKFRTDDLLGLVDWPILVLFMGLFVVAGAFQSTGQGEEAVHRLAQGGFNLSTPFNLTLTTAAMSSLIGNSASVMLLLKIVNLANPVAPYILALANSFGGSLIVIGSVSNIIVVQQAHAMGIRISFWDFARLGIPVTLAALAGLLVWVFLMNQ
jgi:Na+/H+ antiporter NhaD/arsenite permease-like protein